MATSSDTDQEALSWKYKNRPGTIDLGKLYETKMIALISLRSAGRRPEKTWIATNANHVGDFDDIVICNQTPRGTFITYFVQLKHQENARPIKPCEFRNDEKCAKRCICKKSKNFLLSKYRHSFIEIEENINKGAYHDPEMIQHLRKSTNVYIVFTNRKITQNYDFFNAVSKDKLKALDFINTSSSSNENIYAFNDKISNNSEFLQDFLLFTSQANVSELDTLIKRKIKRLLKSFSFTDAQLEAIMQQFLTFITTWSQNKSDELYFLNDLDIIYELAYIVLKSYVPDLSQLNLNFCGSTSKIWNKIMSNQQITIVASDDSVLKFINDFITSEIAKYHDQDHKVEKIGDTLRGKTLKQILETHKDLKASLVKLKDNLQCTTSVDLYKCLWLNNKLPLLLTIQTAEDYNNIIEIVKFANCNLKFVLVKKTTLSLPPNDGCLKPAETLNDLVPENVEDVLNQKVYLQGRSLIPLKTLIDDNMLSNITINDVIHILLGDFSIGNICTHPLAEYYIDRSLYRIIIKTEALENLKDEVFLVQNSDILDFHELQIQTCAVDNIQRVNFNDYNVITVENTANVEQAQMYIRSWTEKPVHLIKVLDDKHCEWKISYGSTKNLKSFRLKLQKDDPEFIYKSDELWQRNNSTIVISAAPGMGKSVLMDFLASRTPTTTWVLKVNLNQFSSYYEQHAGQLLEMQGAEHLRYFHSQILNKSDSKSVLVQQIFEKMLKKNKLIIICDAFDEASLFYRDEVTNIVKSIQKEDRMMWITSRPLMEDHLEENLNVLSTTIKPFSYEDQIKFLNKYFKVICCDKLDSSQETIQITHKFVEKLLKTTKNNFNEKDYMFAGIPLQSKMLADAFKSDYCQAIENKTVNNAIQVFDLVDLYDKFIIAKIQRFCDKNNRNPREKLFEIKDQHQSLCSLKILFDKSLLAFLNIDQKLKQCRDAMEEQFQDEIMITEEEFVHRTFAEYIAAKWLSNNFKSPEETIKNTVCNLLTIRYDSNYSFLFNIFDRLVAVKCPLHLKIINGQLKQLVQNIEKLSNEELTQSDKTGKSVLHLLAIYGDCGPTRSVTEYLINLNEDPCGHITRLIQESFRKDVPVTSDRLGYNPLDYALASGSLLTAEKICGKVENLKINIRISEELKDKYFMYCAMKNYKCLFKQLLNYFIYVENMKFESFDPAFLNSIPIDDEDKRTETFELYADDIFSSYMRSVNYLVLNGCDNFDVDYKETETFKSYTSSMWEISYLVQNYKQDLHVGAAFDFGIYENCLFTQESEVNQPDFLLNTPLHYAVKFYKAKVVEVLLSTKGIDINKQNEDGDTPLHIAIEYHMADVVSTLLNYGADIELSNKKGDSLVNLGLACKNDKIKSLFEKITYNTTYCVPRAKQTSCRINIDNKIIDILISCDIIRSRNTTNNDQKTSLYLAIENNQNDIAELLISRGSNVNIPNTVGNTVLHAAATNGSSKIISLLLEKNADLINKQNNNGQTPLHAACWLGHKEAAELLLVHGASVDIQDVNGNTVLHKAAQHGSSKIIPLLLEKNADLINKQNNHGETPLHLALWLAHKEAAELLLVHGASVDIQDINGNTVLHKAAKHGSSKIISLLLKKNSDLINKQNNNGETPLHAAGRFKEMAELVLVHGASLDIQDFNGNTVLHNAAKHGSSKIASLLLEKNAHLINKQNNNGETPLHLALRLGHKKTAELLLVHGARVDILDVDGNTVLHNAVYLDSPEIITLLLEKIAHLKNIQNNNGETPLHLALRLGHKETVALLLVHGARVDILDVDGNTVLHNAAYPDSPEIITLLLEKIAHLKNIQNNNGETPLHLELRLGHKKTAELLLVHGAHVDIQDVNGKTVLHKVGKHVSSKIICLLLETYADLIYIRNNNGESPIHLALRLGHKETAALLLVHGASVDIQDVNGNTVLHKAAKHGSSEIIPLLLEKNADLINKQNEDGETPLNIAITLNQKKKRRVACFSRGYLV